MKKFLPGLVFVAVMMISCSDSSNMGKDGYKFEEKEYEKTKLTIEFVILKDSKEFKQAQEQYAPNVQGLQAFGRLIPSEDRCIVYIKDPDWDYVPEFIGHEIAHCVWGRWHEGRNSAEEKKNLR